MLQKDYIRTVFPYSLAMLPLKLYVNGNYCFLGKRCDLHTTVLCTSQLSSLAAWSQPQADTSEGRTT